MYLVRVIEFLSEIGPLSPEGRYLFLAIIFEQLNGKEKRIDVSISRLGDSFGVSHKVVSELLKYLQSRDNVGQVTKVRHGKHEFTFNSAYIDSLTEKGFLSVNEVFVEVFSPDVKIVLKEKELKLRPSNLLLIGIFILHANELGFIQSSATGSEELLSEGKIRRLMGGINQSRLKSQLATLHKIGFIKKEAVGGVSPIYFGKFEKRYQIDLGFLSLREASSDDLFVDETERIVSDLMYETPECYLTYRMFKKCSLKYEFEFELPFKLSLLIQKKADIHCERPRKESIETRKRLRKTKPELFMDTYLVDGFDLLGLELAPFIYREGLTLGILAKLETLTALILTKHWYVLTKETFDKLEELLALDPEIQQLVQKGSIFTQKYLKEHDDLELLDRVYCFWKSCLISLSLGLAISLAKVIRGHCGQDAELRMIGLLIHDFQHYLKQEAPFYPSCNISASYFVDDKSYDLNVVSSKSYTTKYITGGRSSIDLHVKTLEKKERTYSILVKANK
ncbi:hypothetical protein [Vibrio vulnificus YJ016]|uniref:Uncharacterized protein n=1 Tax=Vibrio vulnificus (strain YJ016) TaxID=196600 RepID=Q7MNB7_VIBVY|nr:hypothetical protein [Vibrio vulnificus YJ016]